jgi:aspartate racemase
MKTIGVLGGIGPQATMDFEQRLHQAAQRLIPRRGNSGYPPLVVYYHRRPPVLVDEEGRSILPLVPDPQLLDGARKLGQIADFLVITSNGAHMLQAAIEAAAGRPVLSMIEATVAEVVRRGWRHVGVLSLFGPHVYNQPLNEAGIRWESISNELQAPLDRAIMQVVDGSNDAQSTEAARRAVAALRSRGVDGIILGCTEIPLLLDADLDDADLLNPGALLAEAAVRHAMP